MYVSATLITHLLYAIFLFVVIIRINIKGFHGDNLFKNAPKEY